MAYNTKKLFEQAKKAVKDHNLYFIEYIVAYLPCTVSTFYKHFPIESKEMEELKAMIGDNKIKAKTQIIEKLMESPKASELLAALRLIGTPDERRNLNQSYIDHTTKGQKIKEREQIAKLSSEQIDKLIDKLGE